MKRGVTSNVFNDGLVMDMNASVTSSSVLTNCLNGTLLTYNGNENALQNDMGNGRVDLAFLPEGYVPLGTAQLGGIIYVLSYNPLIDKCQIGSFPSPQRNIATDSYSSKITSISNEQFVSENKKIINTIVKVKLNTTILNPGDKFSIFAANNGIYENQEYISDINSANHIINDDPKNITIRIISIGEDGKITYLDNCLKWNSDLGYYIQDCEGIIDNDIMQRNLESKRNLVSSAYNIFNSKVSGELALLFELKVIDSFYLNWDVEVNNTDDKILDKCATVIVRTNWESQHKNINPKYIILSESKFKEEEPCKEYVYKITEDDLKVKKINENGESTTNNRKNDGTDPFIEIKVGDFNYSSNEQLSNLVWNYIFTPAMSFGELDYLSIKGLINFAEIGSGKIDLTRWKYFIGDEYIQLNWGLEAYPEINKEIKYITLTFIPVDSNITINDSKIDIKDSYPSYTINNRISYSGYYTDFIYFNNLNLEKNNLYIVDVNIHYGLKNDDSKVDDVHFYKCLYTTGQWNEQFKNSIIEDFSELTLDTAFNLTSDLINTKNNVSPTVSYGYDSDKLNSRDKPLDNPYYTMGSRVVTVDYDLTNKRFKGDSENFKTEFIIKPDKYEDLFKYESSSENMTYIHSIENSFITHSDITISSDKESSTADVVNSKFEENFNKNIESGIDRAINNPNSLQSDWDNLGDQFEATIITNSTPTNIHLNIKGAIFTRINADITEKSIIPGQIIRPILQNTGDYDKLGLDDNGNLKYMFEESHYNRPRNDPFTFKFSKKASDSPNEYLNSIYNEKSYWNPGDDFSRKTYWQDTPIYDDYLNYWMLQAKGPIQLLRYGYGFHDSENLWGAVWINDKRLNRYCGLWIKTNNGHFMPINNFWETPSKDPISVDKINEISKFIRLFFTQLYYVDTNVSAINRYIVDNINTLNSYTENWNININTNVIGSVDDVISINEQTLYVLQGKLKNVININNIKYSDNYKHDFKNIITIPFKINMDKLYSIYEDNKSTYIPAIYYISTENKYKIGPAKNSNNFYTYKDGKFIQTSSKESIIYTSGNTNISDDGDIDDNEPEYKKINVDVSTVSGYITKEISSALRLKDGELCFDEDTLLSNIFMIEYKVDGGGYARYQGNSELHLPINSKTHEQVVDSNQ